MGAAIEKSQYANPSRLTTCPGCKDRVALNIGPACTQVWNSPRSPQWSTSAGKSCRRTASNSRPTKDDGNCLVSTQVNLARSPPAIMSQANVGVGSCHSGTAIHAPASLVVVRLQKSSFGCTLRIHCLDGTAPEWFGVQKLLRPDQDAAEHISDDQRLAQPLRDEPSGQGRDEHVREISEKSRIWSPPRSMRSRDNSP
jgi:hypothetical protein